MNTHVYLRNRLFVFVLLLVVIAAMSFVTAPPVFANPADRAALEALYHSTDGDNWVNNSGWLGPGDHCHWYGIDCDSSGRVRVISLMRSVQGSLESNNLNGVLPPELGDLTYLTQMSIWSEPNLSGPIPPELGSLTSLTHISFYSVGLSGPIPEELGNLTNLIELRIDGNLSGAIPATLGNLTNLRGLKLNWNNLSGPIPAELGDLTNLIELYLGHNNLSGPIPPELGNLTNMIALSLDDNHLSDPVPLELGNMIALRSIRLETNDPSLCMPPDLQSLVENPGFFYTPPPGGYCNEPPEVTIDAAMVTGDEGSTMVNSGGVSDPNSDPVALMASIGVATNNNDGTWSWSFAFDDGPANSQSVIITADDGNGETAQISFDVTVNNVAPVATLTNSSGAVFEGGMATLIFSGQSDPSLTDMAAGFSYSYDCTDDGTFEQSNILAASYDCPYPTGGRFTARGRIADKDGGYTDSVEPITVLTPQDAVDEAVEDVEVLVDTGVLGHGNGNALISKLDNVQKHLDKDKTAQAIEALQVFIDQVQTFINDGTLPAAEGQALIDAANAIIASLGGN